MICPVCDRFLKSNNNCDYDLTTHKTQIYQFGYRIWFVNPMIVFEAFDELAISPLTRNKIFVYNNDGANIYQTSFYKSDSIFTIPYVPINQIKPYIDKIIKIKAFL